MANKSSDPSRTLNIVREDSETTDEEVMCEISVQPFVSNALVTGDFCKGLLGERSLTEMTAALKEHVRNTKSDLGNAEEMLISQAITLNSIFTELARRSALNMGEYIAASERYMRLALKAQSQCRTTLETVANIQNPPVVFAKQANIAHNQQVNQSVHGVDKLLGQSEESATSHAEKSKSSPNELLTEGSINDLDTRAQKKTSRTDQDLEAVGTFNRA